MTRLLTLAFLTLVLSSGVLYAKPADSDLVIPAEDSLIEQDRIHADKVKAEDVTNDKAQGRAVPRKDPDHISVIPVYSEDDGTTESAADKASTKATPRKKKVQKFSGGIHVGPYNPLNLMGDVTGVTYAQIYGKGAAVLVQLEFEYQFLRAFGKLGVKGGLGFFTAQGPGRFADDTTKPALEIYTLYCLPFTGALSYTFQYWNKQLIVPYVEGGLDYFTITEVRNDTVGLSEVHLGGSTAAHVAAGLKLQLDFLDKQGNWQLDKEYGIQHMYFVLGMRDFVQVAGIYDFSALMFEGGFNFEF